VDIFHALEMSSNRLNLASQSSVFLFNFKYCIIITICDVHEAILCTHLHLVSTYRNINVKRLVTILPSPCHAIILGE
jgi:hypothetical protein